MKYNIVLLSCSTNTYGLFCTEIADVAELCQRPFKLVASVLCGANSEESIEYLGRCKVAGVKYSYNCMQCKIKCGCSFLPVNSSSCQLAKFKNIGNKNQQQHSVLYFSSRRLSCFFFFSIYFDFLKSEQICW